MEDRRLVEQFKRGSTDASRRIYEKYRDHLLIVAIALSHDTSLAEDAVQDVFVTLAGKIGTLRLRRSLKAYLSAIVANRVRDLMRARQLRDASALRPNAQEADANEPDQVIACNEELAQLSAALAQLPHEQTEAIVLHIHGQMRFRAIGESLGISTNTVKGRYRYGINKLRSILNSDVDK